MKKDISEIFVDTMLYISALCILILAFSGCTMMRHSNERYFIGVVNHQNRSLPVSIQDKCAWNTEAPKVIASDRSTYNLLTHEIRYNKDKPKELIHEYTHHVNSTVSRECLEEVDAYNRQLIYELKKKLRHQDFRESNSMWKLR